MAGLLKEMEAGGKPDDEFSKVLLGMMEQLTNKDILYEPMKELHDKFPEWIENNRKSVPEPDMKRYQEQQNLVTEIVAKFEAHDYTDENAEYREYIVRRMQQVRQCEITQAKERALIVIKMQAAGSPPSDLVGDMNAAQEALGELDAGCPQQ